MAEPGPDCSSLLDEDLSSFVFSYLADSQVGSAGGLCCAGPRRAAARGGERTDPPAACRGTPGKSRRWGCGGAGTGSSAGCPAGLRRSRSLRGCGAGRGAVRAPPGAPGRPQPRSPAGAFSTTRTWTPAAPHSPIGGEFGGTGDKLMGGWVSAQNRPPGCYGSPKGGEGAARCRGWGGLRRGLRGGG